MPRPSRFAIAVLFFAGAVAFLVVPPFGVPQENQDDKATPKDDAPAPSGIVLKRRSELSSEDLRKQLLNIPEIGFNQAGASALYANLQIPGATKGGFKKQPAPQDIPADVGMKFFAQVVPGTNQLSPMALPWHTVVDGQMGKEDAERLQVLSTNLRAALRASVPKADIRPDPDKLRALLAASAKKPPLPRTKIGATAGIRSEEWTKPEALPTIMQMLQTENTPIRLLLVEMLADIKGKEASVFLAHRAIFDLSPEVREKAVQELAQRPAKEYEHAMLYGLRYPWPPVADHAAEAVGALQLRGLVPELVNLLKEPNPSLPAKGDKTYFVRELVRVNHLCNCVLCHAPSMSKADLVRGRVPLPNEDPPPLYYSDRTGFFVRADITYLRQDFSVVQPVANAGKWPGNQRYDYIIRVRQATKPELKTALQMEKDKTLQKSFPQREAVLTALRQVTKRDAGDTYESWKAELPKLLKALPDTSKELPKPIQEPPSKKGELGEKDVKDGAGRRSSPGRDGR